MCKLIKKGEEKYYSSLNIDKITDSKNFWKMVKPFFSEQNVRNEKIVLVEKGNIISDDKEVAETMNSYFSKIVPLWDIKGYDSSYTYDSDIDDISNAINKFKGHPSIIKVNENNKDEINFFYNN